MKVSSLITNQMIRDGIRVVSVPDHMRVTRASLKDLENEISAQIDANACMRARSAENAARPYR